MVDFPATYVWVPEERCGFSPLIGSRRFGWHPEVKMRPVVAAPQEQPSRKQECRKQRTQQWTLSRWDTCLPPWRRRFETRSQPTKRNVFKDHQQGTLNLMFESICEGERWPGNWFDGTAFCKLRWAFCYPKPVFFSDKHVHGGRWSSEGCIKL